MNKNLITRSHSRKIYFPIYSAFLVATGFFFVSLLGCGGSGEGSGPNSGTIPTPTPSATSLLTRAKVTINWPERTKAIIAPSSALSAKIRFVTVAGKIVEWYVQRDASKTSAYSSEEAAPENPSFGLPVGEPITLTVTFYAEAQAQTAQTIVGLATATVTLNLDGSGVGSVSVTGSVASVRVLPDQGLTVGTTNDLNFEVLDSQGAVLAVSPGSALWQVVAGDAFLRVSASGTATGIAAGNATVVASVDGKVSASQSVSIISSTPTPSPTSTPTGNGVINVQ